MTDDQIADVIAEAISKKTKIPSPISASDGWRHLTIAGVDFRITDCGAQIDNDATAYAGVAWYADFEGATDTDVISLRVKFRATEAYEELSDKLRAAESHAADQEPGAEAEYADLIDAFAALEEAGDDADWEQCEILSQDWKYSYR